jgi:predicted enzyme related to lactoylglutathione lyase
MARIATHLTNAPVATMLPATDLDRAREFYESKLGLPVDRDANGELHVHAGKGTEIGIYQRGPTKADHTTATFEVDDVRGTVTELRSRGVTFEEYGGPGPVTRDGIAERGGEQAAWFKDSEGNILCVHSAAA